jgi:hypothetical protein
MIGTFALWDELKAYAHEYVASERPEPIDAIAEGWLRATIASALLLENAPDGVFDYYRNELCVMIADHRKAQGGPKPTSMSVLGVTAWHRGPD